MAGCLDERFEGAEAVFGQRFESSGAGLVPWITMALGWPSMGFAIGITLRRSVKLWDYVATLSAVFLVLSCAVEGRFPESWEWWVTFIASTLTCLFSLYAARWLGNRYCCGVDAAALLDDSAAA